MAPLPPRPLVVAGRFCGPAGSGNGGYTAGLLAAQLAGDLEPVTVTLRRPPPLDAPMDVRERTAGAGAELWRGDVLVAAAELGAFTADAVGSVDLETAMAARSSYRGADRHPFPGCFVCGPAREPGDGLRLTPGTIDEGRTACVWVPDPSLVVGDDTSVVGSEFAWASLDCPGGWTSDLEHRPMVLGRMTGSIFAPPRVGRPHVVVGRLLGEDGRKTFTATSLYDAGGLVARAEHTWLAIDPTAFSAG